MPTIEEIRQDPDYKNFSYTQKRQVFNSLFSKEETWGGLSDDQKEEIFYQSIGETPEQASGEIRQGLSKARQKALSVTEDYIEPAMLGGGSALGSIAGGSSPIPGGTYVGGALGYAGAKQSTRALKNMITGDGGVNLKSLVRDPISDLSEGALQELTGRGVSKILEKSAAPLAKKFNTEKILSKAGKMIDVPSFGKGELAKEAAKRGIRYTPAEITGSKTMALMESFLEKLPRSGDVITEFRLKAQLEPLIDNLEKLKRTNASTESIDKMGQKIWDRVNKHLQETTSYSDQQLNMLRDKVLESIGSSKPSYILAEEAQGILKGRSDDSKRNVGDLYSELSKKLPDEKFKTPKLEKASEDILDEASGLPDVDNAVMDYAKWGKGEDSGISKTLEDQLSQVPPEVRREILAERGISTGGRSPKKLKAFAEKIGGRIKKEDLLLGKGGAFKETTPEGRQLSILKASAREDLDDIAKSIPEASEALSKATKAYGKHAETFKTDDIRKIITSKPEGVLGRIIVKDGVRGVQKVKTAIGEKGFTKIKQNLTNDIMGVGKHDTWNPKYLESQMQKYGDPVLEEVYGKQAVSNLKKIARDGLDLSTQSPGMSTLKTLSKEYPDTIVDSLIGVEGKTSLTSKALYKNMKIIKGVLNKEEFSGLGDKLMENILQKENLSKYISPAKYASAIEKYKDRLSVVYPKEKVDEMIIMARITRDIDKANKLAGNPSGTAQMNIQWGLLNLMMSLPGANTSKKVMAGLIGFIPKKMAEFYISPAGTKYLTSGYKVPTDITEGAALATKLATIVGINKTGKEKR